MIKYLPASLEDRLRTRYYEEHSGDSPSFTEWLDQQGIGSAEDAQEHVANEQINRLRTTALMRLNQQVPVRYSSATLTDPQILKWAESIPQEPIGLDRPSPDGSYDCFGESLLVLGPVGTGKTHQAYGLVKWLFERDLFRDIKIATAVELYAQLRPRQGVDSEEVFQSFARCDLLFLDDLGTGKNSEWVEEINYRLVDFRYNHEKPSIITSNVVPAELADRLGDRTASRLTQMADRVVLRGEDRRKQAAA